MFLKAASTASAETGRLRNASIKLARNLDASKSLRLPFFLTITGIVNSIRSYVVKRLSQLVQRRRRRITSPSSETRVSSTVVSSCWQKGHFMMPPPVWSGLLQLVDPERIGQLL